MTDETGKTDMGTVNVIVNPVNDAPLVEVTRTQTTLQYSDTIGAISVTASDVDDVELVLSGSWINEEGGGKTVGLPLALKVSANGCTAYLAGTLCEWSLTGQMQQPSGTYSISFTATDSGGGTVPKKVLTGSAATRFVVEPENSTVILDAGNPVTVQVVADGVDESQAFSIAFSLKERQQQRYGIRRANHHPLQLRPGPG